MSERTTQRDQLNRFSAAQEDKAFQAFKERVPGLIPPKRKPKGGGA